MRLTFRIPGAAYGQPRPRFMKSGHAYTPEAAREYAAKVRRSFIEAYGLTMPLHGALEVDIIAGFEIPASASKKRQELMKSGHIAPVKKPDADNIAKAVLDPLNGNAYQDDAQIIRLRVQKLYMEEPFVQVTIGEVFGDDS